MAVSLRFAGVQVALSTPLSGVWLILNCFAYLATSVTGMLWPQYEQWVSNWVFPVMFGELAVMLWLIIVGAREQQLVTTAA